MTVGTLTMKQRKEEIQMSLTQWGKAHAAVTRTSLAAPTYP